MENIHSESDLTNAIHNLENKQTNEKQELKDQFQQTMHDIKPVNILKDTLADVMESKELKGSLLNTAAGLLAGFIVKTLFIRGSVNPIRRFIGTILMVIISRAILRNPEMIKVGFQRLMEAIKNIRAGRAIAMDAPYNY